MEFQMAATESDLQDEPFLKTKDCPVNTIQDAVYRKIRRLFAQSGLENR